jgi:hypothetical protein
VSIIQTCSCILPALPGENTAEKAAQGKPLALRGKKRIVSER